MLTVALCDDNAQERHSIHQLVLDWSKGTGTNVSVSQFPSAEAFLFSCETVPDIFLLDIEMQGKSGIELAKELRAQGCRSEIIFITSHFEFYGEGYEVDALHYLIKPVSGEKLSSVLDKALTRLARKPPSLLIRSEGETVRLYEDDILYVEAFLHYVSIYTGDREYQVKEPLSAITSRLSQDFYRTHRSYLVSLKKILRISRNSVTLEGGAEIPLARGKYDDVNRAFIERV